MGKRRQKKSEPSNEKGDLQDSKRDQRELENEKTTIDLPDVKDIPGQEYVHPPHLSEYADTTIASSDEEGENIWGDKPIRQDNSNVSDIEKKLLDESANDMPTRDDISLRDAELDNTDADGDLLNEKTSATDVSGGDLDVPGTDEDDEEENIGEEDEENNPYSLGGDDNSINEERSGS